MIKNVMPTNRAPYAGSSIPGAGGSILRKARYAIDSAGDKIISRRMKMKDMIMNRAIDCRFLWLICSALLFI